MTNVLLTPALYRNHKPVVVFSVKDLNRNVTNKSFMGMTEDLLQLYSPNCPHCKNYVGDYTDLAKALKIRGVNTGALNVSNQFQF